MQPLVGVLADRCTSRWGRRRPFMVGGALAVACCLAVLGWTSEVVGVFIADPETKRRVTIVVAVLSIYATDFCINIGMQPRVLEGCRPGLMSVTSASVVPQSHR